MGLRKEMRLQLALPVRVSGENASGAPFEQECMTIDLTPNGVRLARLIQPLRRGAVINISYGAKSTPARVMWTAKNGEAGLQILEGSKNLWGRAIPQIPGDAFRGRTHTPQAKPNPIAEPKLQPQAAPPEHSPSAQLVAGAADDLPQEAKPGCTRHFNFLPRADLLHRMSREPRLKLQVPVRVFGMSKGGRAYVTKALTENVSRTGVYLSGLTTEIRKNEVLILAHQDRKSPFRVMWCRRHDTQSTFDAGLRALEPAKNIWAVDFAEVLADECGPVERRVANRHICAGGISIYSPGTKKFMRGTVADLSLSGCYVEMMAPLNVGDKVALVLQVRDTEMRATAEVRTSHPGMGMGLRFKDLAEKDRSSLKAVISMLERSNPTQEPALEEERPKTESGEILDRREAIQFEYERQRNGSQGTH
jgi:hypothetical protein